MKYRQSVAIAASAAIVAVILDAGAKRWAETNLGDVATRGGDLIQLRLSHNSGVAFGMLAGNGKLVGLLVPAVLLAIAVVIIRSRPATMGWLGAGLLIGGGLANAVDRLGDGRVTDFIDVGIANQRWPTFNLADIFITFGCALLVIDAYQAAVRETDSASR